MQDLEDQINQALKQENVVGLDKLFGQIIKKGSPDEKSQLADAYMTIFAQCQYDYMCGKFNEEEDIWLLLDWVEKAKALCPEMDQYHFYAGHVYEMLSSTCPGNEEKLANADQSIAHFKLQQAITPGDSDVLIDLAKGILKRCQLLDDFGPTVMAEIRDLFVVALSVERRSDAKPGFFGFKGSAIDAFLTTSYDLLLREGSRPYHTLFLQSFDTTLTPFVKDNPIVCYHWADALIRIARWPYDRYPDPTVFNERFVSEIWEKVNTLLKDIEGLSIGDEHFIVALGHLFDQAGRKEKSTAWLNVAIDYYLQACALNDRSWAYPYYTTQCLQIKAQWLLEKGDKAAAKDCFTQGIAILTKAEETVEDFQLSLNHGIFLYEFARHFEGFSNRDTLLEIQDHFEKSRALSRQFYTQPYYALAKVLLRLQNREDCIKVLVSCGELFSNEYHIHDFNEILGHPDLEEIQDDIPKIITGLKQRFSG